MFFAWFSFTFCPVIECRESRRLERVTLLCVFVCVSVRAQWFLCFHFVRVFVEGKWARNRSMLCLQGKHLCTHYSRRTPPALFDARVCVLVTLLSFLRFRWNWCNFPVFFCRSRFTYYTRIEFLQVGKQQQLEREVETKRILRTMCECACVCVKGLVLVCWRVYVWCEGRSRVAFIFSWIFLGIKLETIWECCLKLTRRQILFVCVCVLSCYTYLKFTPVLC